MGNAGAMIRRSGVIVGALLAAVVAAAAVPAPIPVPDEIARLNKEAKALLRSDPQRAQQVAQQALQLAQTQVSPAGEAGARINLGAIERQRGRYDQAVVEFERAVALTNDADTQLPFADALTQLGVTLDMSGLHAEALEAEGKALVIYEAQHDPARISAALINLGNALSNLGDEVRAGDHYRRALAVKRSNGITRGVGSVLNNLADLALESGTTEQAIKLLDEAIAAHTADGDRIGQGLALSNRGVANARAGRFDAALSDIQQGEAIARELEHATGISAALRARAEVWLLRARSLEGESRNYALLTAEREARAALVASSESDDPDRRLRAKRLLADVFAARGEAEPAVALLDEIENESASLRAQHDDARVAVVRARYERQQADTELALLRQRDVAQAAELERNQLLLHGAVALGIAGLTAIVLLFWISRERRIRADALRVQGEALQEALEHAEAQSRRAHAAATLNQRLLAMAGEDLQAPLIEIRSSAERLLAAYHTNPDLARPMATIARHASELIQIVLRMRESAHAAETTDEVAIRSDLSAVLGRCVDDADARASQRQQRLRPTITPSLHVAGRSDTLAHLCSELLDHALRENPADSNIDVMLRSDATQAVLTLSDHDGGLREQLVDAQRGTARDIPTRRLGLGLLRETVTRLGGRIDSIAATAPDTGQLLRMVLPLVE